MTQNVRKVGRHVPELIDGVSYDTKCREKKKDTFLQKLMVFYDTKCRESS